MMLTITQFNGRKIGILGLGRSGLATAKAALGAGAEVVAFDDSPKGMDAALAMGCQAGSASEIAELAAMIVSPGIPLTHPIPHPVIVACRDKGVPLTCDIDLFARAAKSAGHPIIAVTGTNGKSTTTALIGHLLAHTGQQPLVGGNIGKPVFELAITSPGQPIVLEVSSFQLDLCHDLAPDIAVWLNLTPDHLDRHGDIAGYVAAKSRIFDGQTADDIAIIGQDDSISRGLVTLARRVGIGADGDIEFAPGRLFVDDRIVVDFSKATSLRGAHNAQNAAAAFAVAREFVELSPQSWQLAFESFAGLPHRMEACAVCDGVSFINDSKATNPDAAAKSLASYDNIYWIAGGKAKPGGFRALAPFMSRVKCGYGIGAAAPEIAKDLGDLVPIKQAGTLASAMTTAFADARGGHAVVLLAPACASFDQFTSFEARGDMFRELARGICAREVAA